MEIISVAGGTGGGYTGALTRGLADPLENKIKTSTPVIKIDHDGEVVEVYTAKGQCTISNCIHLPTHDEEISVKTTVSFSCCLALTKCLLKSSTCQ